MSPMLLVGILLYGGFLGGEIARKAPLPHTAGFIRAELVLSQGILRPILSRAAVKAAGEIPTRSSCVPEL